MKIIFLDIDGVLNSRRFFANNKAILPPSAQIDPQSVKQLNQITDATGAIIVVSSTWRYAYMHNLSGLRDFLSGHGVTGKVLDITPINNDSRAQQIESWLDSTQRDIKSFVVLDDEDLGGKQLDKFLVLTTKQEGLMPTDVQKAIKILNG